MRNHSQAMKPTSPHRVINMLQIVHYSSEGMKIIDSPVEEFAKVYMYVEKLGPESGCLNYLDGT